MTERGTLESVTSMDQMKASRSNSYNPPSSQLMHLTPRSRRTFSLPCREKPSIRPVPVAAEKRISAFTTVCSSAKTTKNPVQGTAWYTPVVGFALSVLLYLWACLLSLTSSK